jgi:hypothetical protein
MTPAAPETYRRRTAGGGSGAEVHAWRSRMQALITEKESDGRKPITRRLIRLLDVGTVPYYEQPSFEYLD